MPNLSTLIDYCISVGNKSGAIKPAPMGLKKLKESIEGVPFELLTPGMSGIFNNGNLLNGIQQIAQQMGGLENIGGQFQQILSQISAGTVSVDQLLNAFGGVTGMTAALSQYLSATDKQAIAQVSPAQQLASGTAPV